MPKYMTTAEVRETYLKFFESKGHLRYPSHPIPVYDDPTLMFSVAGMTQFKPQFVGAAAKFPGFEGEWKRVTTSQKCIRLNDIENVGRTDRHCSLFEMLGNFSFDSYFKQEAIAWAWELLTDPKWFGLEKERMYATIYKDDDEAFQYWQDVGMPASHINRFDADENFWPQDAPKKGPNGPCGPCSEIYYDRGEAYGTDTWEDYATNPESNRYLEIWNLVFPGYNRSDGPDGTGALEDLGRRNIDTGMGMVRVVGIMQGVQDFYDSDDFVPLIKEIENLSGKKYEGPKSVSHRVIAEHVRMVSMTLADGVRFDNTGREYVVRKVMRRASRHAYLLGMKEPVIFQLVPIVAQTLGQHYPEIVQNLEKVQKQIREEEARFLKTLERGIEKLNEFLAIEGLRQGKRVIDSGPVAELEFETVWLSWADKLLSGDSFKFQNAIGKVATEERNRLANSAVIPAYPSQFPLWNLEVAPFPYKLNGDEAFMLYDTFGFPLDLTIEICEERGVTVDQAGFDAAYKTAQKLAQDGSKFKNLELFSKSADELEDVIRVHGTTKFIGYEAIAGRSKILAILKNGEATTNATEGDHVQLVLETTPFYAEGGGQVGDAGMIEWDHGMAAVSVTKKTPQGIYLHDAQIQRGRLELETQVDARVNPARLDSQRHHTATHLLQAAMRAVLGSHVQQRGSLVTPERLRFDFTNDEAVSGEQIRKIELLVNRWIEANFQVSYAFMPIDEARATGAMALFGEKYGDIVRVVSVDGNVSSIGVIEPVTEISSKELCGGTHVGNTGEIGAFVIVSEEGVAAGVRRIEALCGETAIAFIRENLERIREISRSVNATPETLVERIEKMQDELKAANKQIADLKSQLVRAQTAGGTSADNLELGGFKIARLALDGVGGNELRAAADDLMDKTQADIVVVGSEGGLVVKASKDAVTRGAHAGNLIGKLAQAGGGKGGGRPDMAQAGVKDVKGALAALEGAL
jgi:alanyl-tRNA synthetase